MVIRPIYRQNFRSKLHRLIFAQYRKNGRKSDKKSVTHEGTFPGAGALSRRDLATLVDLSELCLW
jgi:hypothetical protein